MIYADTSCLLKLLRPEPLSGQVWSALEAESAVVISALAELETLVQLKAAWTGGSVTRNQWRQAEAKFAILRNQPPFESRCGQPGLSRQLCGSIGIQVTCIAARWNACISPSWKN